MMTEIIRELTAIKKANEVTSEYVLPLAWRVEVQRSQKGIIEVTKRVKCLNMSKHKSKGKMH